MFYIIQDIMRLEYLVLAMLIAIVLYLSYKIYEFIYYRSDKFKELKEKVNKHVDECNNLNHHIEELKNTLVVNNSYDYGNSTYADKSRYKYKRKYYKKVKLEPQICNCSRTICDGSRKKPFQYLCKYFNIGYNEEDLQKVENMLNNYEAVEEGKLLLLNEREIIVKRIKKEVPLFILALGDRILIKKLGFENIDLKTVYFPKYIFRYVSSGGNASLENEIILNISNLNKLITYLSENIKFKQSVIGQRALLTSKLRKKILVRDGFICQHCGNSINKEPNLLLEIDHKIPLSKGGMTTEDNLQVLCWRCNRKKGNKTEINF